MGTLHRIANFSAARQPTRLQNWKLNKSQTEILSTRLQIHTEKLLTQNVWARCTYVPISRLLMIQIRQHFFFLLTPVIPRCLPLTLINYLILFIYVMSCLCNYFI